MPAQQDPHAPLSADSDALALPQRCQRLLAQIEDAQGLLARWQEQSARFGEERARRTDGPAAALAERQAEVAERIDAWLARAEPVPGVTHEELREALCLLAEELLDSADLAAARRDDVRRLRDRHADARGPAGRTGFGALPGGPWSEAGPRPAPRPRPAAPAPSIPNAQAAARQVREVYRRLASSVHPDRAGDPRDELARTTLMQRLNRAYEARDVPALVQLESELGRHEFRDSLFAETGEGPALLESLARQLVELQSRINGYETAFRDAYFYSHVGPLDPRHLGRLIDEELRSLQLEQGEADRDLRDLETPRGLRRFVERHRAARRAPEDPDDLY